MNDPLFFDVNDYIYSMSDDETSITSMNTNNNEEVTEENKLDVEGANELTYSLVESEENESYLESEYEDTESIFSLDENQVFISWKEVDKCFECYGQANCFAFCVTHSENDKVDNKPQRRVYGCTKRQKYIQHKEAHMLDERNKGHKAESKSQVNCSEASNIHKDRKDELQKITNLEVGKNYTNRENISSNHQDSNDYDDIGESSSSGTRHAESLIRMNHEDYNNYENIEEFSLSDTRHNFEGLTSIADKSRHCGVCGQAGHNSRTCNSKEPSNCENIGVESLTRT
ncbi:44536_t:CDS:2, partial [Gigaspora margarita]